MHSSKGSLKIRELFPLGRGGMGVTYLGCSRAGGGFERLVVIKRLHEHLQEDEKACKRLAEEAELAGAVHHRNVVPVLHVDRDERGTFLVLDYVEGTSLFGLRRFANGKIPEPIVLRIILDALSGLEAIHSASDHFGRPLHILHRDISPENILVSSDGTARLTDFGIAKSETSEIFTEPSQLIGKVTYMAPEYLERRKLGPPVDIYSLGVTLWALLAGESPWRDLEEAQVLVRILTRGVPELPPTLDVSDSLRAVVARACDQDPALRFQSAREMAMAIKALPDEQRIADPSEVAAFVMEFAGPSVSRVREQAARFLALPSAPPESEGDVSLAPEGIRRMPPIAALPRIETTLADPRESARTVIQPQVFTGRVEGEATKESLGKRVLVSGEEKTAPSPAFTLPFEMPADEGSLGAYALETSTRKTVEECARFPVASNPRRAMNWSRVTYQAGVLVSILLLTAIGSAWLVTAARFEREVPFEAEPSVRAAAGERETNAPLPPTFHEKEFPVTPPVRLDEPLSSRSLPSSSIGTVPTEAVPSAPPPTQGRGRGSSRKTNLREMGETPPPPKPSEIVVENPYD